MQPEQRTPSRHEIEFTFDGQRYVGYAGDTIAAALYRAGVRVFSRSFKYHRPRGLLCLDGSCPNCLVNVDGTPNVRSCTSALQPGADVRSQNAWPSLDRDALAVVDRLEWLLPVGFYYKRFIRPRRLWPVYESVLRNIAGLGVINPDPDAFDEAIYDKQYRHAQVAVVGGGPAGLAAAVAAAESGGEVTLVDENPALGGHWRYQNRQLGDGTTEGPDVNQLIGRVESHARITVLREAVAFGWYADNLLGIQQGNRLIKLRCEQLVVATGRIEQPLVFRNNDLPGVFLSTGVQRLVNCHGIRPGRRALVVTTGDYGWTVARDLLSQGVDVAMVADARPEPKHPGLDQVGRAGVPSLPGHTIQSADGDHVVQGATLVRIGPHGAPVPGTEIELNCDIIALATGFVANNSLLYQSGCVIEYDAEVDDFVPTQCPPGVLAAGHAAATDGLEAVVLDGQVAGLEAALSLPDIDGQDLQHVIAERHRQLHEARERLRPAQSVRPLVSTASAGKRFVCYCEDVTEKDVRVAIGEGFDDVETLKRYTTVGMGPCQGKMCSMNAVRLCARETGRTVAATGRTTSRPPFRPVKLGVLAGRKLEPVRRTPLHYEHVALGAKMMDAGQWKRPEHYGDPATEVRTVRSNVGIIDVSTLGKIDVRGPDVVAFLDRMYTGRFGDLEIGQLHYGVMCTDEGIVLDDGVVGRIADDHYYLTTTSGGIDAVYQWLTWWLAGWQMAVHVVNVTADFAAINVAGPRARDLMGRLTDLDLSTSAFPYMEFREGSVADVCARLLRIGFVGELSYELHFPAEYGVHVWRRLLTAGADLGVAPFGVEAQRILRLEKKHIIIGQDTDALSDPLGAGLAWSVKDNGADFIGQPSLARTRKRGPIEQLVGFQMLDASVVPGEGEQIVSDGQIIGRVSSARYSPTLDRSIGIGWVEVDRSHEGAVLQIKTAGEIAYATVVVDPFYDPRGRRLRE